MTAAGVDADVLSVMAAVCRDIAEAQLGPPDAWARLAELGFSGLTRAEDHGGSGATLAESAALLRALAARGVALPVVEHDLLATNLLERLDLPVGDAVRTYAELDEDGRARDVAWTGMSASIAVTFRRDEHWSAADVPASDCSIIPRSNLADEPRSDVAIDISGLVPTPVDATVVHELRQRGALARAVQITGALEAIVALVVEHSLVRHQFGRPLAAFQAVQQVVADLAAEAALATAATDAAVAAVVSDGWSDAEVAVAIARSCAGHAVTVVTRGAHQVFGAIGTTSEHQLHRLTLPAIAWRSEFGTTVEWDRVVARHAMNQPSVWELITR